MKPVKLSGTLGDAGLQVVLESGDLQQALEVVSCVLETAHYSAMDLLEKAETADTQCQAAALDYAVTIARGVVNSAIGIERAREAAP